MRLAIVLAAIALAVATAFGAEPSAPAKRAAEGMRYPTLEKMLRRFAAQAGTASTGRTFASR